ncbi:MAG TPA: hypothetical protein EYG68_01525 [Leucothrix mucor]|nr:hypothetical protein [Leucothrix mucor]
MTLEIRSALVIEAYQAQQDKSWGAITQLSKQYQTSRTFIYSLLSHFKRALGHLVFPEDKPDALSMADIEAQLLAQRFV